MREDLGRWRRTRRGGSVHHGPGDRLYSLRDGGAVVVPFAGDMGSRRRDIKRAGWLAEEWRQT